MRNWLIYEPPGGALATLDDTEKFVVVREGFSKSAFFLAPFWLAFRRCWLGLALWAAALALAAALFHVADVRGGSGVALLLLPSLAIGLESAWLHARALERRGFTLAGAATARTREEAEIAFFSDWLAAAPSPDSAPTTSRGTPYQPASSGVLGLFPAPGASR